MKGVGNSIFPLCCALKREPRVAYGIEHDRQQGTPDVRHETLRTLTLTT